ncbi:MAG TPA: hypothetical protein VIL04_13230 [Solirubrobacterales bacterium]
MLALSACAAASPHEALAQDDGPGERRVIVVVMPEGINLATLSAIPDAAVALMSGGIGSVPASQTYLDITQGARTNASVYPEDVPLVLVNPVRGVQPAKWRIVKRRAREAPAEVEPGLLGSALQAAGLPTRALPEAGNAGVIAVNREGELDVSRCRACPGLTVTASRVSTVVDLALDRRPGDLLIAFERPPADRRDQLSVAIVGLGQGVLHSDSTRRDGYVLSTDVAPTILSHLGVEIPDAMAGRPLTVNPDSDLAAVQELEERMGAVGERRRSALGVNLLIWLGLVVLAGLAFRRRGLRVALPLLAVSAAYLPTVLLLTAALRPSATGEQVIAGVLSPALALVTLLLLRGWGALALASGVTVVAHAVDVIVGSPLTSLSLMGPNPALGVRFFGIGNELESALTALLMVGVGAGLAAWWPNASSAQAAIVFAGAALLGVAAFAPGRFGADVGAAIVIPVGAAAAIAAYAGGGRGRVLLILAAPVAALAALMAIDLALGGDAHLSRSVLEAGGLDEVGQVAERRLRLSAKSFANYSDSIALWAAVAALLAGIVWRRRVLSWFERPAARAGFLGAAAATLVGTVANDSGALILMVGTAVTSLCAAYAWAGRRA